MSVMIAEIKGHEAYKITSQGEVIGKRGKILKPIMTNGYCRVDLYDNKKHNLVFIHRLVADAFLPNPNDYPQINHKDENPQNNNVSNLEWCTQAYNNAYGTRGKKVTRKELNRKDCSKAVVQFSYNGEYVATYPSAKEAWRKTGIDRAHICACCNHYNKFHTAGGYRWKWESEIKDGSYDLPCIFR